MGMTTNWTDEQIERLRVLWALDYTMLQIADELGTTRNAVSGRISRLRAKGYKFKDRQGYTTQKPRTPLRKARSYRVGFISTKRAEYTPEDAASEETMVHFMDKKIGHCSYPLFDFASRQAYNFNELYYCGKQTDETYCMIHSQLCTRPAQ